MRPCVKCGLDIDSSLTTSPGLCSPYGTCRDGLDDLKPRATSPQAAELPNCRDRTCSGAVYERNAAKANATALADALGECAALERRLVEIRDEAAIEIAWLKRELQRNDPRLYKARYERSTLTGSKET